MSSENFIGDYNDDISYFSSPLNPSVFITNTSATASGTYVDVSCTYGYQLSSLAVQGAQSAVFYCLDSYWFPSTPSCVEAPTYYGLPWGVIVGCTVGAILSVLLVIFAALLCFRKDKEVLIDKQQEKMQEAKNMHINYFMSTFNLSAVGLESVPPDYWETEIQRGIKLHIPYLQEDQYTPDTPDCGRMKRYASTSHHGSMESLDSAGELEERENTSKA